MLNTKIQDSILKTLIYHNIFDYSPSECEITRYLIGYKCLDNQILQEELQKIAKIYTRKGNNDKEKKNTLAWSLLNKTHFLTQFLAKIPTIQLIGVSGDTAALNAKKNSDIDLMVICQNQTAWLTRSFILLLLSLLRQRVNLQKPNHLNTGKFCLNMMLEDHPSSLQTIHQDLYTAMEIAHLKILLNRNQTYQRFLLANNWTKKYLPNFWTITKHEWELRNVKTPAYAKASAGKQKSKIKTTTQNQKNANNLLSMINQITEKLQNFNYYRKYKKRLDLKNSWQIDYREKTLTEYQKRMKGLLSSS